MKKILITLIIGLSFAGLANATLWDFYNGNLPSVSDRASEATECDINDYTGTYEQNIKLEKCLREKSFLGASTSTVPTPAPSLYKNQTWTGINTYTSSTISSGNNTFSGTNNFSATTTLPANYTYIGSTSTDTLISGGNASNYHTHNKDVLLYSTSTTFNGTGTTTLTHNLGRIPQLITASIGGHLTANGATFCTGYGSATSTASQYYYWVAGGDAASSFESSYDGFAKCQISNADNIRFTLTGITSSTITFNEISGGASGNGRFNLIFNLY